MFNSVNFAGKKDLTIIRGGEGRQGGGVTEMPNKKLPGLEGQFGSDEGKKGDRSGGRRLLDLLG